MYELVSISCGELTVQYTTDNLRRLADMWQKMETSRVRHDGKLLTTAETYKLFNGKINSNYMPRVVKPQEGGAVCENY